MSTNSVSLSPTGDPWLLTPGPLTTSPEVKQAMLHDFGSRDHDFINVNRRVREELAALVDGNGAYTCVPLQGSGTFVVEAMLGTLVPPGGKALVLVNGAYGQRIAKILDYHGRAKVVQECPENEPVDSQRLAQALADDADITHVVAVHCETTTGILNPLKEVADTVAAAGRKLLIDAMSAFGVIELKASDLQFDAVAASSNKCLQGTPGMGFCIARKGALETCEGNSPSLSLDLYDQWMAMEKSAQWRFTPPVQVIAAFGKALEEYQAEGGQPGRLARYRENCRILIDGMERMGFQPLLPENLQAPIIVTFMMPDNPKFEFQAFYDSLKDKGFVIYPGKLTIADTFRIGCIGALGREQMEAALDAIQLTLDEMGVALLSPAA
ncbi:MAG: 2-aminoethylphosphonate--pyruvate transaminase [Rhodospirillaceae bacterium]|nr:2-aminoethylphosphonate--pyruvate transaminase [Rhodospirillaceae bacterium]